MQAAEMTLDAEPTLAADEQTQLQHLEAVVEKGLRSFIEVGEALSAIRERRLYRATHGTFEDYCVARWGMKRAHAYRLMSAAEIVSPIGDAAKAITTESQARELASVPAPERAAVVEKAIQATGGKITAAAIREAARAEAVVVEVVVESPAKFPLPAHQFSAASHAAADQAERDSGHLWMLKSTWRKTNKKDRAAFINEIVQSFAAAERPLKWPSISNGSQYADLAISQLDKIQPGDTERVAALQHVVAYALQRIAKRK